MNKSVIQIYCNVEITGLFKSSQALALNVYLLNLLKVIIYSSITIKRSLYSLNTAVFSAFCHHPKM